MSPASEEKGETDKEEVQSVTVDGAIILAGEYGRFQIMVNAMFCVMTFPSVFHVMLMYFAADIPDWSCRKNSTKCNVSGTFKHDEEIDIRCAGKRGEDWEFVTPSDYSIVTDFNVVCDDEWILPITVSVFFVGWIAGSVVLGWFSDNYGRKIVIFVSSGAILLTGALTTLMPNIYAVICCRFVIGFFIPGTFQVMIIVMTEIVGANYRAFSGNIIFIFATSGMALLGLKAYFIRQWKHLHLACTVPYFVILLFWKFIPESLRTLAVKGKSRALMQTLRRMAKFNNRELPVKFVVRTESSVVTSEKSNPLDLFRKRSLAKKTFCQVMGYVVGGMTFYGLYLAAKEIGTKKYRDFVTVTMCEIPIAFLAIAICERFGRKKTVFGFYGIGMACCIGLCFTPKNESVIRTVLGMMGKCSIGPGYNTLQTWTMELYPTYVRAMAMGVLQAVTRLAAAFAPVVNDRLTDTAAFTVFAAITLSAICLLPPLKEMKGEDMGETEQEGEVETNFEIMQEMEAPVEDSKDKVDEGATVSYVNRLYDEIHGEGRGEREEGVSVQAIANPAYEASQFDFAEVELTVL